MIKNDDKWVGHFRKRMEGYSEPLPEGLWEKLEKELPPSRVVPMWKRKWFAAAAVIMLLAVSSVSFWFMQSASEALDNGNQLARQIERQINRRTDRVKEQVADIHSEPVKEVLSTMARSLGIEPYSAHVEEKTTPVLVALNVHSDSVVVSEVPMKVEEAVPDDAAEPENEMQVSVMHSGRSQLESDRRTMKRNRSRQAGSGQEKKSGNVTLGLNAGNTPITSSSAIGGFTRFSSMMNGNLISDTGPMQDVMPSYPADNALSSQTIMYKSDAQSITHINHKIPVTVGASVKWDLNDKWALETGLNYTFLSSELTTGEVTYVKEEQKLHYIGVPLKVHRSLWENRVVSFYVSAGTTLEKCVSSKLESVSVDKDLKKSKESISLDEKPFQVSLGAALGAQLNLSKHLGLYVEPGLAYYFDDGTNLETIRKEHPLNFNLQLGLRINLNE